MSLTLNLVAEPHILLILVAVAFIAGFIDAIAGGGGYSFHSCEPPVVHG